MKAEDKITMNEVLHVSENQELEVEKDAGNNAMDIFSIIDNLLDSPPIFMDDFAEFYEQQKRWGEEYRKSFKMRLRTLRAIYQLSREKLADKLQMSYKTIWEYEHGVSEPDIKTLVQIANLFHVSVDYLVGNAHSFLNADTIIEKRHLDSKQLIPIMDKHFHPKRLKTLCDKMIKRRPYLAK